MKLIVGLGNPGRDYENTRHNMGFMCISHYALGNGIHNFKRKFNGDYAKFDVDGEVVILLKPLSYMNLSGGVVRKFVDYFKISIDDILIIHDDIDLPIGSYRLKIKGSSGGHNGIKSVIDCLNTENFKRLKIGISKDNTIDVSDYVVGKISANDMEIYNKLFSIVDKIINDFVINDYNMLMNKYNGVTNEFN